jgi:hypothetical protein
VNSLAFIASIVHSIALPAGVVIAAAIFRRQLSTAINQRMRRVKVGPFEAEFDPVMADVRRLRAGARNWPVPSPAHSPTA